MVVELETKASKFKPQKIAADLQALISTVYSIVHHEFIQSSFYDPQKDQPTKLPPNAQKHAKLCDFCKADIFNRSYHCKLCNDKKGIDICLDCIAEERVCKHLHHVELQQDISMNLLFSILNRSKNVYHSCLALLNKDEVANARTFESLTFCDERSTATIAFEMMVQRKMVYQNLCLTLLE